MFYRSPERQNPGKPVLKSQTQEQKLFRSDLENRSPFFFSIASQVFHTFPIFHQKTRGSPGNSFGVMWLADGHNTQEALSAL